MTFGEFFSLVAALGTCIAAIAAWRAAVSSQKMVEEAQLSRKLETKPRVFLDRSFQRLRMLRPPKSEVEAFPSLIVDSAETGSSNVQPTFFFVNSGGGPALEPDFNFEFHDGDEEIVFPEGFPIPEAIEDVPRVRLEYIPAKEDHPEFNLIHFISAKNEEMTLEHQSTWHQYRHKLLEGETVEVKFPRDIWARIFLRGIQRWNPPGEDKGPLIKRQTALLEITARYRTIDGETVSDVFKYEIRFRGTRGSPIDIDIELTELPLYDKERP
ncbi:hypothetical protein [uncultured Ruegeria sp.]|uniref:hypothetical protein n=1 Tax=uncultured Ruegeria sp. TaxID=259304 RepID=UPI00261DCE49|nr:hypothetical protein [uncultured Ruegeria sp.]